MRVVAKCGTALRPHTVALSLILALTAAAARPPTASRLGASLAADAEALERAIDALDESTALPLLEKDNRQKWSLDELLSATDLTPTMKTRELERRMWAGGQLPPCPAEPTPSCAYMGESRRAKRTMPLHKTVDERKKTPFETKLELCQSYWSIDKSGFCRMCTARKSGQCASARRKGSGYLAGAYPCQPVDLPVGRSARMQVQAMAEKRKRWNTSPSVEAKFRLRRNLDPKTLGARRPRSPPPAVAAARLCPHCDSPTAARRPCRRRWPAAYAAAPAVLRSLRPVPRRRAVVRRDARGLGGKRGA